MTDDYIDAESSTRLLTEDAPPDTARLLTETASPNPASLLPPPRRPQTMTDHFLLNLIEEIVKALSESDGNSPCTEMVPSYNAILSTAKSNHPNHPFLSLLSPIEKDRFINVAVLMALFAQVRIVLESLQAAPQS